MGIFSQIIIYKVPQITFLMSRRKSRKSRNYSCEQRYLGNNWGGNSHFCDFRYFREKRGTTNTLRDTDFYVTQIVISRSRRKSRKSRNYSCEREHKGLYAIDNSKDAIFKDIVCIEVDKDTYLQIHELKICPCLFPKHILHFLHAL